MENGRRGAARHAASREPAVGDPYNKNTCITAQAWSMAGEIRETEEMRMVMRERANASPVQRVVAR